MTTSVSWSSILFDCSVHRDGISLARARAGWERTRSSQSGISLVELMIAIALGLFVLATLTVVFVNNSSARRELDKSADVLENGHYAMSMLSTELSQAGYYGTLVTPSGSTDKPCSTNVSEWGSSLEYHVHGGNQDDTSAFDCIGASLKPNTDVVFIQRASTCVAGPVVDPGCTPLAAGAAYLQVSECGDEYQVSVCSTPPSDCVLNGNCACVLQANSGTPATRYPLKKRLAGSTDCDVAGTAPIRKVYHSIYYVDTGNVLMRLDVDAGSGSVPPGTPVEIAANVENMQIEYGIDNDGDGSPDSFVAVPADWTQVVGVRLWLLVRAGNPTPGYQDDKTYTLGDFTSAPADRSASDQSYKRHVFSGYVSFINVVGRRAKP